MLREYTKFLLRGKRLANTTKKIYYCVVDPEQGRSASEQLGFQENLEEELRPRPYTFGLNLVINVARLVGDHIKSTMHFNNMRYDEINK